MPLYDGFFDATQNEETGKYDRDYGSDEFTSYFAKVIGSGVCVHDNPDSFLVRLEDGQAVVSRGYLFIQGYWLKNDADYPVALPGSGNYAIVAHLNLGARMIELEARTVSTAYTDSLVLAIVSPSAAEDTRYNTDLCGVIDTAGELSTKVEWAVNYIDNEIEAKLAGIEAQIASHSAKLDAKIAQVQAVADSIVPPPVGTIKFSAAQNVGEEWIRCDGSFVNEADYPELVAALGKLTPSADKFQVISDGEIGPQISNGVIYEGRMWVYSYSTQKLYGVDVKGEEKIKEIDVTSNDRDFSSVNIPSTTAPIALSIVKSPVDDTVRLFLAQLRTSDIWIYGGELSSEAGSIELKKPFESVTPTVNPLPSKCVPYVISENVGGAETFSMATKLVNAALTYIQWTSNDGAAKSYTVNSRSDSSGLGASSTYTHYINKAQRVTYNSKSKNEAVYVDSYRNVYKNSNGSGTVYYTYIRSLNKDTFARNYSSANAENLEEVLDTPSPLNIVGEDKLLFEPSTSAALVISLKDLDLPRKVNFGLSLPSGARTFVDAGAYLWGKDIYMLFVGTGIIFSRTLEEGSFGYLDTTDILGQITQFGYLDYSQDEGTLYLLGQDTTNSVKLAKIELNTLYNYANDGAWLPMLASDGVPAYIKAYEPESDGGEVITDPVEMKVAVTIDANFARYADLLFNDEPFVAGTFTRTVSKSGNFTVGVRIKYRNNGSSTRVGVKLGGTLVASVSSISNVGTEDIAFFKVSDYATNGITLTGAWDV